MSGPVASSSKSPVFSRISRLSSGLGAVKVPAQVAAVRFHIRRSPKSNTELSLLRYILPRLAYANHKLPIHITYLEPPKGEAASVVAEASAKAADSAAGSSTGVDAAAGKEGETENVEDSKPKFARRPAWTSRGDPSYGKMVVEFTNAERKPVEVKLTGVNPTVLTTTIYKSLGLTLLPPPPSPPPKPRQNKSKAKTENVAEFELYQAEGQLDNAAQSLEGVMDQPDASTPGPAAEASR